MRAAHYNLPVHRAAVEWVRGVLLARGPSELGADALTFVLRDYIASGSEDARALVEQGLAAALANAAAETDAGRRLRWLRVLTEASIVSDDPRLRDAVTQLLPPAIDALEAFVRRSYEPGEGLLDQGCGVHVYGAAALLDAFDLCGRLPYPMLADELLQHARRQWWRSTPGRFDADFVVNCEGLRALCRMAALHDDHDYRAAAVVAPLSSCAADARRLAEYVSGESGQHPADAAAFGCAMLDWFALEPKLQ
jgi:hypothetical protein